MGASIEAFIPIVAIVMGISIPLFSMYLSYRRRELFHKERLTAMEKGINLPEPVEEEARPKNPSRYLLHGMVWLFIGGAIFYFFLAMANAPDGPPSAVAFLGLIPGGIGAAMLLYYSMKGKELRADYEKALERLERRNGSS